MRSRAAVAAVPAAVPRRGLARIGAALRRGLLLVAITALTACGDPKMQQMLEVREAACRCKDAACVDAALARLPSRGPKDRPRAQRLAAEILQCLARVGERAPD